MPNDDIDFDALGLSDEALGIAEGAAEGGASPEQKESGGGRRGRRRGRRGFLLFFTGLLLGIAGTILIPRYLGPYLPVALRSGSGEPVEGEVLGKRLEADRLLLTVGTARGAVLATFRNRVAEIDLLIAEGDSIALGLGRYRPFVEDPAVEGVRKAAGWGPGVSGGPSSDTAGTPARPSAAEAAGDTVAAGDSVATPDSAGNGPAGAGEARRNRDAI